MVIVALGLGWYLDHNDPRRTEIVGTWHAQPSGEMGYSTTLEIYPDGTFEKTAILRMHQEIYSGTYHLEKNGVITFHAILITTKNDLLPGLNQILKQQNQHEITEDPPVAMDATYSILCAVDKNQHLLLHCQSEKKSLDP